MKRILVADDHALVRKGLRETLDEELGGVSVTEAQNGKQALEQLKHGEWDLVVMDINMEGMSGFEVLAELRALRPKLPVLVLSMYPESEFGIRALKSGAAGYLNKQSASEELVTAVRKVLEGGRYVSPALGERLACELGGPVQRMPHELLSNRELQVMRMIAQGKSLKEIAFDLAISAKTVGTYHLRLLEKLGLRSDVEITRYAIRNGLVE